METLIDVPPGHVAAVVTSLEMTERAAPRPEASGAFILRTEPAADPDWYRTLFRRIGADWLWFSRLRVETAALAATLRDPQREVHALVVDGRDAGLLELNFRDPPDCELSFFGVDRKAIGGGAGRWLMNRAIERAWARPIARFWVHTCTLDHPAALAFYIRSGFRPYKRQIEIAPDPRLTGDLPRDAAPHVPIL
ncbi:MAG TPA: GNAT family N-acetyltransferase [Stellaceae bacterium]|nr:GNAT family N-acetyltransferase [Stellaceae bacterium]